MVQAMDFISGSIPKLPEDKISAFLSLSNILYHMPGHSEKEPAQVKLMGVSNYSPIQEILYLFL